MITYECVIPETQTDKRVLTIAIDDEVVYACAVSGPDVSEKAMRLLIHLRDSVDKTPRVASLREILLADRNNILLLPCYRDLMERRYMCTVRDRAATLPCVVMALDAHEAERKLRAAFPNATTYSIHNPVYTKDKL